VTTLLGNYDIFWNINADTIELALRVKTTGWVGFGIGEQTTGGMGGADIVTVQVWPNGTAAAVDRFSLGNEVPLADTCQDWTLVSASEANGVTTVELRRALSTGDAQDHPLGVNKQLRTKVLVAHGASDDFAYHAANVRRPVPAIGPLGSARPAGDRLMQPQLCLAQCARALAAHTWSRYAAICVASRLLRGSGVEFGSGRVCQRSDQRLL